MFEYPIEVLEEEKDRIKNLKPIVMKSYYKNKISKLQQAINVLEIYKYSQPVKKLGKSYKERRRSNGDNKIHK